MKRLFVFFIVLFFQKIASAQTFFPDEFISKSTELDLKDNVKKLVSCSYYLKDKDGDTTGKGWRTVYEFDSNENVTSVVNYSPRGKILHRNSYDYSKKDSVIVSHFDGANNKDNYVILCYNEKQQLVEADQYLTRPNVMAFKTKYKYDSSGDRVEEILYFHRGDTANHSLYTFNAKRQKITAKHAFYNRNFSSKIQFFYDSSGRLSLEVENALPDSSLVRTKKNYSVYDTKGNWLRKTTNELMFSDHVKSNYTDSTIEKEMAAWNLNGGKKINYKDSVMKILKNINLPADNLESTTIEVRKIIYSK